MRIAIAGSSGLIGGALRRHLSATGHDVHSLVRHEPFDRTQRRIDADRGRVEGGLGDVDVVINLAGLGIADGRWSAAYKKELRSSRVATTATIRREINEADRDITWLNGSAVGYYGHRGDETLTEDSSGGSGFLADLVHDWEEEAATERARVIRLRTGHVLSAHGGLLGKQRLLFKLGLGGPIGDGAQYLSWITLQDYCRAVEFLIGSDVEGPVNMTAPNPEQQRDFAKEFATSLNRPAVVPMPTTLVGLLFTHEMVKETLLASQRALPEVLLERGFAFEHEHLGDALVSLR